MVCKGKVKRVPVEMVVDTGCSYTLVHSSLVPDAKFTQDQWVGVQCAHGNVIEYPVAKVDIEIDGVSKGVEVGVSPKLPRKVLIGRDLIDLFGIRGVKSCMVFTRNQSRCQQEMEERQQEKEWKTGAQPKSVLSEEEEDVNAMEDLEDDIFGEPGKLRKPRSQRRKEKLQWKKEQEVSVRHDEIIRMQLEDETLDKIRKYAKGEIPTPPRVQFTEKGLLYRVCGARQRFEDEDLEQLILPVPCREKVLKLAHTIPLAGHLG